MALDRGGLKRVLKVSRSLVLALMGELRIVGWLLGLTMVFVIIGSRAAPLANALKEAGETHEENLVRKPAVYADASIAWLNVKSEQPWEMKPEDLTGQRVLYNLLTKPGLRQLILTFFTTALMMVGIYIYWPRKMGKGPLTHVVNGTVHVISGGGVIYLAQKQQTTSDEEEYTLYAWVYPADLVAMV